MAIVKATYTRRATTAKSAVRYIENRPGKDGSRTVRTLFTGNGQVERTEVYEMIDQATHGSYFFRLVISPDPKSEDSDKHLSLRDITERTIQRLEHRLQQPIQWAAAIHADHTDARHIHAIVILPQRLTVQDFQRMRSVATEAALEQRQQLDLAREAAERSQAQSDDLGLELLW